MLKTPIQIALIAVLALNLIGCATPEERRRRDAQRAREDAQWEAERRRRDREDSRRDADDYQDYLVGYARSLGKTVSQLTADERADARREYDRGGYGRGYGYRHGYGYWW